jgi:hypothetical protein
LAVVGDTSAPSSSSITSSVRTSTLARSSSIPNSARWRAPPRRIASPSRQASSGPSTRNCGGALTSIPITTDYETTHPGWQADPDHARQRPVTAGGGRS